MSRQFHLHAPLPPVLILLCFLRTEVTAHATYKPLSSVTRVAYSMSQASNITELSVRAMSYACDMT